MSSTHYKCYGAGYGAGFSKGHATVVAAAAIVLYECIRFLVIKGVGKIKK